MLRAMDLSKFIEKIGDPEAARLFNVTERCAASWRYKYRFPRPETARDIEVKTAQYVADPPPTLAPEVVADLATVTFAECFIPKPEPGQAAA